MTSDGGTHDPDVADARAPCRRMRQDEFAFRLARHKAMASHMTTDARASHERDRALGPRVQRTAPHVARDLSGETHVRELMRYHHAEFVEIAYQNILQRPADPEGFHNALRHLESGGSKIALLEGLRYSPEGRSRHVRLRGLLPRYWMERMFRVPFIGYALETIAILLRLPVLIRHHRALEVHVNAQSRIMREELQSSIAAMQREDAGLRSDIESLRAAAEAEAMKLEQSRHEALVRARKMNRLYGALEDEFRGARDEIKGRVAVYLPHVHRAGAGSTTSPVIDLGCGRGEWLELLTEHHLVARGVDDSEESVKRCRARGLDVVQADAVEYLRSLPDGSVGAVTAMHVVEHLDFPVMCELIENAARVLNPGGVLIIETPNPRNVLVASNTFYLDPTHLHPLPSALLKFVVEKSGLPRSEVMELHPSAHVWPTLESELDRYLVENLFGPQDYAVIATKGAPPGSSAS